MTRDELVAAALKVVGGAQSLAGVTNPLRIVVVVCDEEGAFTGVSSNVGVHDTAILLQSALFGALRMEHPDDGEATTPATAELLQISVGDEKP